MKMAHAFIGHYIISTNFCFRMASLLFLLFVVSADASEVKIVKDAAAGLRLEIPLKEKKSTPMDVAIFTELSPVVVSETPVKLPEKQKPQ